MQSNSRAAILVSVFLSFAACRQGERPTSDALLRADASWPNIVLISIDTLRPDHLGAFGYKRKTSPNIDALATSGALFENAISSTSWTLPAHAALFTGLSDSVHGSDDVHRRLDDSRHTLAERLSSLGYRTAGFFAGPFLHPTFGLAQGFDTYVDCSSYARISRRLAESTGTLYTPDLVGRAQRDVTNPRVYLEVQRWLRENQQSPFFLFIHLWDTHFDFIPPAPYDEMFDPEYEGEISGSKFMHDSRVNKNMSRRDLDHIIALYDGEIAWTDAHVGRILEDLDALGLSDRTIVALVSDHGEEFFEHGGKGHQATLYEEVIRIPLVLRYPERIAPGIRIPDQVRIIDLLPTLLELAGAPAPNDVMGQSLVPLLEGRTLEHDNLAISELNTLGKRLRSYRRNDRKLLRDQGKRQSQFYDLRIDHRERLPNHPTATPGDWERQLLRDASTGDAELARQRQRFPVDPPEPWLSAELAEQLRVLGYLGDEEAVGDAHSGAETPETFEKSNGIPPQPGGRFGR